MSDPYRESTPQPVQTNQQGQAAGSGSQHYQQRVVDANGPSYQLDGSRIAQTGSAWPIIYGVLGLIVTSNFMVSLLSQPSSWESLSSDLAYVSNKSIIGMAMFGGFIFSIPALVLSLLTSIAMFKRQKKARILAVCTVIFSGLATLLLIMVPLLAMVDVLPDEENAAAVVRLFLIVALVVVLALHAAVFAHLCKSQKLKNALNK